jgi:hypothetical protein
MNPLAVEEQLDTFFVGNDEEGRLIEDKLFECPWHKFLVF